MSLTTKEPNPDHFTGSPAARVRLAISTALSRIRAIPSCDTGGSSSWEMVWIRSFLFMLFIFSPAVFHRNAALLFSCQCGIHSLRLSFGKPPAAIRSMTRGISCRYLSIKRPSRTGSYLPASCNIHPTDFCTRG